jgi:hypothetical protein
MTRPPRNALSALTLAAVVLLSGGCGPAPTGGQANVPPPGGQPMVPRDSGGPPSNIKQIMSKIGKPPSRLNDAIGDGLKADQPAWDALQPQAKQYAELTAALAKMDAPKGNKDSWAQQTTGYAASAASLDDAVQAKDRDAAKAAQTKLTNSCRSCHMEFRGGGRPPG